MIFVHNAWPVWRRSFWLGLFSSLLLANPLQAAENIFLTYGPLKFSIRVNSLQQFVQDGTVDANLRFYFNLAGASPEQLQELRQILNKQLPVEPGLTSRFLNSQLGIDLLKRVGLIINQPWGTNGNYALRAAIVEASFEKGGLSLVNVLQKLPVDIHLQGEVLLTRGRTVQLVIDASEYFINQMEILSYQEAQKVGTSVDFSQLPDPRQPGSYGVQPRQVWHLRDNSRERNFYVNVYRPQRWKEGKTPVVVFSHGLASRPEDFSQIAEHLASHGFVVVLPQHPGSDFQQAEALVNGTSRQVFLLNEFIDRPLDITYVLDELERRNPSQFENRLNLTQVGVGGHSFGGYTALAVGGARFDWDALKNDCDPVNGLPNVSLLLQCQALKLPQKDYQFRDRRVASLVLGNPVNSAVFGIKGLHAVSIPVMIIGGSYDPATPFVLEQVRTFPRLGSSQKYLLLAEGQAHVDFSQLDPGFKDMVKSFGDLTLPNPDVLHSYLAAYATPFLEVYTAQNDSYQTFLTYGAAYAQYLSRGQEFRVFFIGPASVQSLINTILEFRRSRGLTYIPNEYPVLAQPTTVAK
jgi:predicted dienelactone hydrolase